MKTVGDIDLWKEADIIAENMELEPYLKGAPKALRD